MTIEAGGLRLGCRLEGSGEPLVLLHGMHSHSGTWRKLFPLLIERFLVFAPSLPSYPGQPMETVVERWADLVSSACGALRILDASLIGNSIGGWVAMRLSEDRGLVGRLVLEATAGGESPDSDRLASSLVPTLLVWGTEDDVTPLSRGRILNSKLAGSRLEVIQGAGHVPHWEQPERFLTLVETFFGLRSSGV